MARLSTWMGAWPDCPWIRHRGQLLCSNPSSVLPTPFHCLHSSYHFPFPCYLFLSLRFNPFPGASTECGDRRAQNRNIVSNRLIIRHFRSQRKLGLVRYHTYIWQDVSVLNITRLERCFLLRKQFHSQAGHNQCPTGINSPSNDSSQSREPRDTKEVVTCKIKHLQNICKNVLDCDQSNYSSRIILSYIFILEPYMKWIGWPVAEIWPFEMNLRCEVGRRSSIYTLMPCTPLR